MAKSHSPISYSKYQYASAYKISDDFEFMLLQSPKCLKVCSSPYFNIINDKGTKLISDPTY